MRTTFGIITVRCDNCGRLCFYCDLSAFERHSRFRALCYFLGAIWSRSSMPPHLKE